MSDKCARARTHTHTHTHTHTQQHMELKENGTSLFFIVFFSFLCQGSIDREDAIGFAPKGFN